MEPTSKKSRVGGEMELSLLQFGQATPLVKPSSITIDDSTMTQSIGLHMLLRKYYNNFAIPLFGEVSPFFQWRRYSDRLDNKPLVPLVFQKILFATRFEMGVEVAVGASLWRAPWKNQNIAIFSRLDIALMTTGVFTSAMDFKKESPSLVVRGELFKGGFLTFSCQGALSLSTISYECSAGVRPTK